MSCSNQWLLVDLLVEHVQLILRLASSCSIWPVLKSVMLQVLEGYPTDQLSLTYRRINGLLGARTRLIGSMINKEMPSDQINPDTISWTVTL